MVPEKHAQKRVLILVFSDVSRDPRVLREITALKDLYSVTVAAFGRVHIDGVNFLPLEPQLPQTIAERLSSKFSILLRFLTRGYLRYYWGQQCIKTAYAQMEKLRFDLILANDIETLPLALKIAGGAPVLFDAHEYAPLQYENIPKMRVLDTPYKHFLCRQFIPKTAAFVCVAAGIAEQYRKDTGASAQVVTNAPAYVDQQPRLLHGAESAIEMIHHGAAIRGRRLELLIDMMEHLGPRYRLTLMLVPTDAEYLQELQRLAAGRRVVFRTPVPFDQIVTTLASYDIGLAVIYPGNFNYLHCLPNKFFEFAQARMAIVTGPSPEMAPLVAKHGLGAVAAEFTARSLAEAVAGLTVENINRCKVNSDKVAPAMSADHNIVLLQDIARGLLDGSRERATAEQVPN